MLGRLVLQSLHPQLLFRLPLSTQSHSGVLESAVLLLDPDIAWLFDLG